MTDKFDDWWNEDDLTTSGNNFVEGTPAYWAWEGWCAGVKAEREACAKLCDYVYNNIVTDEHIKDMAFKIRARGETK